MKKTQRKTKSVSSIGRTKVKPKKKAKGFIVKAPPIEKLEEDKDLVKLQIQILFAKIRANRKELSKTHGKEFDKLYDQLKNVDFIKASQKELKEYLQRVRKYRKELKNKPKALPFYDHYNEGLLTLKEFKALDGKEKEKYFRIVNQNVDKMVFYIKGEADDNVRPTNDVLQKLKKERDEKIRINAEYAKKYWTSPLTTAQLHLIAITTKQGVIPQYMGKPLSTENIYELEKYKRESRGYQEYLKKIDRINFLKSDFEKKVQPLKKIQEQYQSIGRRLRQTAFRPEQELLEKIKSWGLPIEKIVETTDKDTKKRVDVKLKFDDGKEVDVEIKDKNFNYSYKLEGEDQEVDPNIVLPKKNRLVRQHGLKEYMDRNELNDVLDFPEHFLKHNDPNNTDYKVIDYDDVGALAQSCGVIPYEVFVQLCQHIVKIKPRLEKDKNLFTAMVAEEIVNYFDNQVAEAKKKKHSGKYTLAKLYRSKFFKDWTVKYKLEKHFKSNKRLYDEWDSLYKIATAEARRKVN